MPSQPITRTATPSDLRALAHIIGTAFADDPVSRWAMGSPALVADTFKALITQVYLPRGHCTLLGGQAAALWLGPGGRKQLPLVATLGLGLRLLGQAHPRHSWRAWQLDQALQARRPSVPHLYLFAVGVLPAARGQGLGRQLLGHTLRQCDAQGLPVFLENTHPRNLPLYASLGFEALETYAPVRGCPVVTAMWRRPVP
jgi:GNAT superfamily N-acetyltransferase